MLTKNSSKKIPKMFNSPQKSKKNLQTISQKIPMILKVSNSLHRT